MKSDLGCGCLISEYYDEDADFYDERNPRAKKEHICCECGETIKVGETYNKVTGKWDGNICSYKTCMPCANIRRDYYRMMDKLGFDYVTGKSAYETETKEPT